MQLISLCSQIFSQTKKQRLWLKPYEIIATGKGCGLVEFVSDALSIDYIRQKIVQLNPNGYMELLDYFKLNWGSEDCKDFK